MTIELELAPGPAADAVGRLVLGGLGARLGLGVDRVIKTQEALHTTLQEPPSGATLVLTMKPTSEDLRVTLGPFDRARKASVEELRIVSALVDELCTHETEDDVWVDLRVTRRRPTPAGR